MNNIPEGWKIKRVKEVAKWKIGFTPSSDNTLFYEGNDTWVTIRDMDKREISNSKNEINGKLFPTHWKTPKHSLLFSFKLSVGQVAFATKDLFTNEAICSFLPSSKINLKFMYYAAPVFLLKNAKKNIYDAALLNQDLIANAKIYYPPLSQQTAIANYLDYHTDKIDKEISLLEKKVELLDEYKQAIIFETVTKGLNKNVPMKDSGIDWIGEIPAHWEVKRVKDVCQSLGGGNYGEEEEKPGLLLPCISISDFKHGNLIDTTKIKMFRKYPKTNTLKAGSILIEKSGGGEKNPVGRIIYLKNDIIAYYTNFVQAVKTKQNSNYVHYCFINFHNYRLHMPFVKQNTGLQNFDFTAFQREFFFPIPPNTEQQEIALNLDAKMIKIKKNKEVLNKKIELLKEYKQSLIYEAVTGKMAIKENK